MTTTKQYDFLNRLTPISSVPSAASAISYAYLYNSANQRTRARLADGSYWLYTYDSLGQVIAGNKYWPDETPVAGAAVRLRLRHHRQPDRRPRPAATRMAQNLRSASYTANNLNQYTQRTVPGYVDIMGLGFATNAVTVNGQTAYRKGEYFRQQLSVANSSAPVWQSVTEPRRTRPDHGDRQPVRAQDARAVRLRRRRQPDQRRPLELHLGCREPAGAA